jgi:hypothetical protein
LLTLRPFAQQPSFSFHIAFYWVVNVTAVECTVEPEVATIVTVDVVAADDVVPPELEGADGPD